MIIFTLVFLHIKYRGLLAKQGKSQSRQLPLELGLRNCLSDYAEAPYLKGDIIFIFTLINYGEATMGYPDAIAPSSEISELSAYLPGCN
jgi:hypothetical protein